MSTLVMSWKCFTIPAYHFSFIHHRNETFATEHFKNTGHDHIRLHHVQNVRSQIKCIRYGPVQCMQFYKTFCSYRLLLKLQNPLWTISGLSLLCLKCLDMTGNSLSPLFQQMWSGIWLWSISIKNMFQKLSYCYIHIQANTSSQQKTVSTSAATDQPRLSI